MTRPLVLPVAHPAENAPVRVCVLGDLILDHYVSGTTRRISQEAPVLVLEQEEEEYRPGGAASVAYLLRGLGAEVELVGVTGEDAHRDVLLGLLRRDRINCTAVVADPDRPTTIKHRFLGLAAGRHRQQILRVDRESTQSISAQVQEHLAALLESALERCQVLLISDYAKGVCTPGLLQHAVQAARRRGVPVVVDPARVKDYRPYAGATLITPNRTEAGMASGQRIDSPQRAITAARVLCSQHRFHAVLVTLDAQGMVLVEQGQGKHFPTQAREVYDVTGAGDMVLAAVGVCLARGMTLPQAVPVANAAAGLEVQHLGVAQVSWDEVQRALGAAAAAAPPQRKHLSLEQAAAVAAELRGQGKQVVFTNGCFDLLHAGHVTYLAEAKAQGDVLFVGLNSDESIRALKGPTRPVQKLPSRLAVLSALEMVDYVVVFGELTPVKLIEAIRPHVLVKGGDYRGREEEITGRELLARWGGRLHLATFVPGVSTTKITETIRDVAA